MSGKSTLFVFVVWSVLTGLIVYNAYEILKKIEVVVPNTENTIQEIYSNTR